MDAVINHMCFYGSGTGHGSGGSSYNSQATYFPAVPYSSHDFNCGRQCPSTYCIIHNYLDAVEVPTLVTLVTMTMTLGLEKPRFLKVFFRGG